MFVRGFGGDPTKLTLRHRGIRAASFSPTATRSSRAATIGKVRVWRADGSYRLDASTPRPREKSRAHEHARGRGVGGSRASVAHVALLDSGDGRLVADLRGTTLEFSRDGSLLATGHPDSLARIYQADAGTLVLATRPRRPGHIGRFSARRQAARDRERRRRGAGVRRREGHAVAADAQRDEHRRERALQRRRQVHRHSGSRRSRTRLERVERTRARHVQRPSRHRLRCLVQSRRPSGDHRIRRRDGSHLGHRARESAARARSRARRVRAHGLHRRRHHSRGRPRATGWRASGASGTASSSSRRQRALPDRRRRSRRLAARDRR